MSSNQSRHTFNAGFSVIYLTHAHIIAWILQASEAFIDKAPKGEVVGVLLRILGNAAYESLRFALRVKFGEKIKSHLFKFSITVLYIIFFKIVSHQISCTIQVYQAIPLPFIPPLLIP